MAGICERLGCGWGPEANDDRHPTQSRCPTFLLDSVHDSRGRRLIGSLPGVVSGSNPANGVETAVSDAINSTESNNGCRVFHNE